jgi:lipoate-protein ligase A
LYGDLNRILEALNFSDEERAVQAELLPQRATTLAQVLGRQLAYEQVMAALTEGFAEQLNLTLQKLPLTAAEQALADKLRAEQYAHDSWNKRV